MADHAENSNSGRVTRSTPSRRRTSTPPTQSDATLLEGAQPREPGGDVTLDLFGDGLALAPVPAPVPESAGAMQAVSAKTDRATAVPAARRGGRAKPAAAAGDVAGLSEEPAGLVDEQLEGEAPQAAVATSHAASEPEHGLKAEAPQTEILQAAIAPEEVRHTGEQADGQAADTVQLQPEVTAGQDQTDASNESAPDLRAAGDEPKAVPSEPGGFSYAPTNVTGNAARVISVVHPAEVEAAVHGPVPERAVAAMPAEIVAAMAAQARKTKWMLTAALAALVVTAGVAIVQTILLANLSADSQAQQQRIEVLMQNQQAALDGVSARLAAPAVVAVPAPEVAATNTVRAPASATPPHHAARAARTPKPPEKAAARTSGSAQSKAHAQQAARQAAAKS
jgi:plasmid stability protein